MKEAPAEDRLGVVGDRGEFHQPRPLGDAKSWRLMIRGDGVSPQDLSLEDLASIPTAGSTFRRDITCVSAAKIVRGGGPIDFTGLPFSQLVAYLKLEPAPTVEFISRAPGAVGPRSRRHRTSLPWEDCVAPEGLGAANAVILVTALEGAPLPYHHGGPLRSIPGEHLFFYKGIKWLEEIRLRQEAPDSYRGTWEEHAGYHNQARVALNERFEPVLRRIVAVSELGEGVQEDVTEAIAPEDWTATFQRLLDQRDFSRLAAAQVHKGVGKMPKDLRGFKFVDGPYRAKIRGTSFAGCDLSGAHMAGGNFSLSKFTNTRFSQDGENPADLTGCDFEGTYFNNAWLQNVPMAGACLTNVSFFADRDEDKATERVRGLDVRGAVNLSERNRAWLERNGALV